MPRYLLAIETSAVPGSAALFADGELAGERTLAPDARHDRDLFPALQRCLADAALRASDLACVAVGKGPGSYTGTRIGLMAAKALAFGGGVPLVGVSSLAALAWDARETAAFVVPVQEARRDEVYAAVYGRAPDNAPDAAPTAADAPAWQAVVPDRACTPEEAAALARGPEYSLVGAALSRYAEAFASRAVAGSRLVPDRTAPRAASLGCLAWHAFLAGRTDDVFRLQPQYLRREGDPSPFA